MSLAYDGLLSSDIVSGLIDLKTIWIPPDCAIAISVLVNMMKNAFQGIAIHTKPKNLE